MRLFTFAHWFPLPTLHEPFFSHFLFFFFRFASTIFGYSILFRLTWLIFAAFPCPSNGRSTNEHFASLMNPKKRLKMSKIRKRMTDRPKGWQRPVDGTYFEWMQLLAAFNGCPRMTWCLVDDSGWLLGGWLYFEVATGYI